MAILVTGGAGFIGSHTCVELIRRGHQVIVADDHSNSSPAALAAIRNVSGGDLIAYQADLRDRQAMEQIFTENQITRLFTSRPGNPSGSPCRYRSTTTTATSAARSASST